MRGAQEKVRLFMIEARQMCPRHPVMPGKDVRDLRVKLHREEAVTELEEAFAAGSLVKVADSIGDSLVVVLGTAVACGIDIQPIFEEIMRSNMTKFVDGTFREDGKYIKGPNYSPADIAPLLALQ